MVSLNRTFDSNPAWEPGKCGLEIVGELNDPGACYDFDDTIVWRDLETGELYAGRDSGCSCPTPFEDFHSLSDMVPIRTVDDFNGIAVGEYCPYRSEEVQELRRKIENILSSGAKK